MTKKAGVLIIGAGCAIGIFLYTWRCGGILWLDGRTNSASPTSLLLLLALLAMLSLPCLAVFAIVAAMRRQGHKALTLAIAFLLGLSAFFIPTPEVGFQEFGMRGFCRWVQKNVNEQAIDQQVAAIALPEKESAPPWGYLFGDWSTWSTPLGRLVPKDQWPPSIAKLSPDDVRVVGAKEDCILLCWMPHSFFGSVRFVAVTRGEGELPTLLITPIVIGQTVMPHVWAGERLSH
jgi:hypothetical protein